MKNVGLIPLRNFAMIDRARRIYRSAQPMYAYEYKWLEDNFNIKMIINLRSEKDMDSRLSKGTDIKTVTFDVPDHHIPTLEQAHQFMNLIQKNKDVLIHCEHGRGRTSTFSVLAKLALGWDLNDAIEHEKEEYKYPFYHKEQIQFLTENFS